MKIDPMGQFHLANDGVVRSYSADGKVIDCPFSSPLDPR